MFDFQPGAVLLSLLCQYKNVSSCLRIWCAAFSITLSYPSASSLSFPISQNLSGNVSSSCLSCPSLPLPPDLRYLFLLLILSYYVSSSSSLTDHPSLQMTGTQRHQTNREKTTTRKRASSLACVKISSVLTEGVVEDDRKNDTRLFPDWKNSLAEWSLTHTHTHTHTQMCMHRNSNVDRKTACCQDGVFIYCFPSVSVHAP